MTTQENAILLLAIALGLLVMKLRAAFRQEFVVENGFSGLLYRRGKFRALLKPGKHVRWGRHYRVLLVDTRRMLINAPSQEAVTLDQIPVKVNVILNAQIVNAAKACHAVANYASYLNTATQIAVRATVAKNHVNTLTKRRRAMSLELLHTLKPQAAKAGIEIHSVDVREITVISDSLAQAPA